jgi:crossover junction endodeoxyribonuclease RusA
VKIELAWPDAILNPNARAHFMALSRAKKAAKEAANWSTRSVKPLAWKHDGSRLPVKIIAHPPINRNRDADNCIASLKAPLDGVAAALGVNDSLFDLSFEWGEVISRGKIIVEVGNG